jgi:hypothetical protein
LYIVSITNALGATITPFGKKNETRIKIQIEEKLGLLQLENGYVYTYYGQNENAHFIETQNSVVLIDGLSNPQEMAILNGYIEGLKKPVSNIFLLSPKRKYGFFKNILYIKSNIITNEYLINKHNLRDSVAIKYTSVNIDGLIIEIKHIKGDYILLKLPHYGILIGSDLFSNINKPKSKYKLNKKEKVKYKIILVGKGKNLFLH